MTDESSRLRRFKDAVYAEAEGKVNRIIAEAQAEKDEILDKANKSAQAFIEAELAKTDREEDNRLVRGVSSARLDSQRSILLHREEVADKVFENVRQRIARFRESGEYADWLKNAVAAAAKKYPDRKATALVCADDAKYAEDIRKSAGADVETSSSILLGGAMVSFDGINAVLDVTFDSAVERERQDFCRSSQTAVK